VTHPSLIYCSNKIYIEEEPAAKKIVSRGIKKGKKEHSYPEHLVLLHSGECSG
jgi:hypothetical protein